MKSQVLHTVWCYISGEAAGGNLKLITLGSERVGSSSKHQYCVTQSAVVTELKRLKFSTERLYLPRTSHSDFDGGAPWRIYPVNHGHSEVSVGWRHANHQYPRLVQYREIYGRLFERYLFLLYVSTAYTHPAPEQRLVGLSRQLRS